MKDSIKSRLEALEKRYRQDPLYVEVSLENGGTEIVTMRECLRRGYHCFCRVVAGSSMQDLKDFLDAVRADAEREALENERTENDEQNHANNEQ